MGGPERPPDGAFGPAVRAVRVKSVLSPSKIRGIDYSLNPYVGCAFGCRYCYADFMGRFAGHAGETWGRFVDVKENAPELLRRELVRKKPGVIGLSLVTDPYQPLEGEHGLTRRCLEAILERGDFEVSVLTRSPLVVRDTHLFLALGDRAQVGLSVTTDDEDVRRLFEPGAPPVDRRLEALRTLRAAGVHTYAFVGPALPMNPHRLASRLAGIVEFVYLDRLNYAWKVREIYRSHRLENRLAPGYFRYVANAFRSVLEKAGIPIRPAGDSTGG